jgi:nicotinamide mononucleotide transporter
VIALCDLCVASVISFLDQLRAWSPAESLAAALGLAYLLLAVRRNLWCWICAFASTVIYFVIFLRASLYMQTALQVFYLVMAGIGFYDWQRGRTSEGEVAIRSWNAAQHFAAVAAVAVASAINGWVLTSETNAVAPYLDSFVTWGSVITTWMVARRVVENWLYWVVVDGIAAYLYFTQHLYPTTLLFVIYVGIVVRGYVVWRREQRSQVRAAMGVADVAR